MSNFFAITCTDKPGQPEVRQETRPNHLDYPNGFAGQMVAAGLMPGE